VKRRTDGLKNGWKEGKTGEKMDRLTEGRMEGGKDGRTDRRR
jgi:hypothetical protein